MPCEISWYKQGRIILSTAFDTVLFEDVLDASETVAHHIREGNPPVHIVADLTGIGRFPANIVKLRTANAHLKEPGIGWTVVISNNRFVIFVSTLLSEAANVQFRAFPGIEQALKFLSEQDNTLAL